jgi:hypothetical protein
VNRWKRFRSKTGRIYYQANISDTIILQVWQHGYKWQWLILGWPTGDINIGIFRQGIAKTLKEATSQIELLVPRVEQQQSWIQANV